MVMKNHQPGDFNRDQVHRRAFKLILLLKGWCTASSGDAPRCILSSSRYPRLG